jgi:hypothetical protein
VVFVIQAIFVYKLSILINNIIKKQKLIYYFTLGVVYDGGVGGRSRMIIGGGVTGAGGRCRIITKYITIVVFISKQFIGLAN